MEVSKTSLMSDLNLPPLAMHRPGPVQMAPETVSQPADPEFVSRMVEEANKALSGEQHLQFKVHEGTQSIVVRLIDEATGDVLREYPSEKFLDVVSELQRIAGVNVDVTL